MSAEKISSEALHRAILTSESYRIIGFLCLLGALLIYVIGRALAVGQPRLFLAQFLALLVVLAHEGLMLRVVKRALLQGEEVPPWMWMLNVFIETQVPTAAILLLIKSGTIAPYKALVAPALLLYFIFIVFSVLRFDSGISFLTGLASALGYLTVALYTRTTYPQVETEPAAFQLPVYFVYAGAILLAGIVAAVVSGRLRVYVAAAQREAELQNELDRISHDLSLARSIQQGLLPTHAPQLDAFEIAGWNQPADQTGGDYFDWQELADGRIAISLGDATGHGIGPALVSTSCRAYARASVLAGNGQGDLLNRLNQLLVNDLSSNRFVTFAVMFLDPLSFRVNVLSAGHGPILYYRRATDEIESLEAQGIPLGMIASINYERGSERQLEPGDMLVLVTDGFYEWEDPQGAEFGMARLEAVIRESRDESAEEIIRKLRTAVIAYVKGTKQKDDLTAVVLKRKAEPVATSA